MSRLKIVAGIGSVEDYPSLVEAGADDLFGGYLPYDYMEKLGRNRPLNRREVIYYNVQLGSESELMILKDMIADYNVKLSITFNSIGMDESMRLEAVAIIDRLTQLGFKHFIIADYELIKLLASREDIFIEISGELGEINRGICPLLGQKNVKRLIFPRQTKPGEMKTIIDNCPYEVEFEAFVLNEKCHFTGAYCNSVHCDELCHMCKVPYKIVGPDSDKIVVHNEAHSQAFNTSETLTGLSGCGLCALWKLKAAGVTHLKLVSRGNYIENTISDIKALKKALDILESSRGESEYIERMKNNLFPSGCSGNCYYF